MIIYLYIYDIIYEYSYKMDNHKILLLPEIISNIFIVDDCIVGDILGLFLTNKYYRCDESRTNY
jgi:hypothetical protein